MDIHIRGESAARQRDDRRIRRIGGIARRLAHKRRRGAMVADHALESAVLERDGVRALGVHRKRRRAGRVEWIVSVVRVAAGRIGPVDYRRVELEIPDHSPVLDDIEHGQTVRHLARFVRIRFLDVDGIVADCMARAVENAAERGRLVIVAVPLVAGDDPAVAVDVGGEGDRGVCEREAGVLIGAAHRLREVGELSIR